MLTIEQLNAADVYEVWQGGELRASYHRIDDCVANLHTRDNADDLPNQEVRGIVGRDGTDRAVWATPAADVVAAFDKATRDAALISRMKDAAQRGYWQ